MEQKAPSISPIGWGAALIVGLCLIAGTLIGSWTFYRARSLDNSLSVTGSATKAVTSDKVKWISAISRDVLASSLQQGYVQLASDLDAAEAFFAARGVATSTLVVSPIFMNQVYKSNDNAPLEYTLRQTIELDSSDVSGVTAMAKDTQALIAKGVFFSTESLQYFYSGLADLRVSLLGDALKDARARAAEIATSGGSAVGDLKSASSGVVQVLPPNSVDISDYGNYDTSTVDKEVMVTVHAAFSLR